MVLRNAATRRIRIADVEVYVSAPSRKAAGMSVSMSSEASSANAVGGCFDGIASTLCKTAPGIGQWLQIDLGYSQFQISSVVLRERDYHRSASLELRIGPTTQPLIHSVNHSLTHMDALHMRATRYARACCVVWPGGERIGSSVLAARTRPPPTSPSRSRARAWMQHRVPRPTTGSPPGAGRGTP